MKQGQLLTLAALALAACAKQPATTSAPANALIAPTNATAAAPAASPKLAKIFTADVLGSNVAFLETITGPAFRTDGDERTYKVDGCTIVVGATAGKIDNIGIANYGPACSFPIAQYFAGGYDHPAPQLPTFGDLQRGLGGDYGADCLRLCGNAADPVVSLTYQGSHADNFNTLYAAVPVVDDAVVAAYTTWGDKLAAKYGDQRLIEGTAKLDDTMQNTAQAAFAAVRPTTIRVGSKLPGGGG
ncbi:MAG TPA: hypothetical protein VGI95_18740 [Caulobacteraceae bacterium]|jgi:hypothetical protein